LLGVASQVEPNGKGRNARLEQAGVHLDKSVKLLLEAGQQDHLPRGFLARAALRRVRGDFDAAKTDLKEAESIAKRSSMLPFQVDASLERCRWHLAQDDKGAARAALVHAKELVKQTEVLYVPHLPTWKGGKPLEYEGVRYDNVFKEDEIVGYHRRNPEIAVLERALEG
ncbi:MAG: hypothetical protein L3K26_16195, partial [Candidatus Hydrogenedentes bacterium]|nr:hypothetical protein [Candidatus Hydrogenedentota bacterium]